MTKPKILIELDPQTQNLHVEGPMNDAVLFLGMLDTARVVFLERRILGKPKENQRIVVPMPRV